MAENYIQLSARVERAWKALQVMKDTGLHDELVEAERIGARIMGSNELQELLRSMGLSPEIPAPEQLAQVEELRKALEGGGPDAVQQPRILTPADA